MARILNSRGKSAHSALRPIQKLSFQKKAAQLAKQSASVSHVMFAKNALSTRSLTMNALEFGADSPNASVAV
jgi:hypothetical protein